VSERSKDGPISFSLNNAHGYLPRKGSSLGYFFLFCFDLMILTKDDAKSISSFIIVMVP
jgi:hypothetical protein